MTSTTYVVQLFSEEEEQRIGSVAEVKTVGQSVHLLGDGDQVIAIYSADDIQKLAPVSQH